MKKIQVTNVSLMFRMYNDGHGSIKEYLTSLLNFRNIKRPSYKKFWANKDISFGIQDGERVGIIGRNGAGKSTLLKILSGVYKPTIGSVLVNGTVAPLLEVGAAFNQECTGRENIYFNGAVLGYTKKAIKEIEQEIIDVSEVGEYIDTPVKYYSTGMYMKLGFSLATSVHPDILILDELFAGGDASFVEKAKTRMRNMIDRASVLILVSHDHNLLRDLCTRFIWIDNGKLLMDGGMEVLNEYMRNSRGK